MVRGCVYREGRGAGAVDEGKRSKRRMKGEIDTYKTEF
jgi:hypothetical protein